MANSIQDLIDTGRVFELGSKEHGEMEAEIERFQLLPGEEQHRIFTAPHADVLEHFPTCFAPRYTEGEYGPWTMDMVENAMARGYFNGLRMTKENWRLKRDGKVWMSLMLVELESQMPHFYAASGVVVNCGLGMGFSLMNFAAKDSVTEVHVVEQDQLVIDMFLECSDFEEWPEEWQDKVRFHCQSAFDPIPCVTEVDFLFVDIWVGMCEDTMVEDTQRIYAQYERCTKVGMWTQEMDFITWFMEARNGRTLEGITVEDHRAWAADRKLPLMGEDMAFYYPWFENVAINMLNY